MCRITDLYKCVITEHHKISVSSEPTSITLSDVSKSFADLDVLRGVDLAAEQGRVTAILGPSGSGKSTILRIIAGLIAPDSGEVLFNDHDMSGVTPKDRHVSMVFQNHALFSHLTVAKNVEFGLEARNVPREERKKRVKETLELTGLTDKKEDRPATLSGGESQRVALARAIVTRPCVLLFDEPFSSLDATLRQSLRLETRRIQRELGVTTLLVTHDQEEAFEFADNVTLLSEGHILGSGTPEELYYHPKQRAVAEFMGLHNHVSKSELMELGIDWKLLVAQKALSPLTHTSGASQHSRRAESERERNPSNGNEINEFALHPHRIIFKPTKSGAWVVITSIFKGFWSYVRAEHRSTGLKLDSYQLSTLSIPRRGDAADLIVCT